MKPLVSVCIISLGRHTLYKTLNSLLLQKFEFEFEIILILQGDFDLKHFYEKENSFKIPIRVYHYNRGHGFGFYRNRAVQHSHGNICVWIDDDEYAMDEHWLLSLTQPILEGYYQVVTSGYLVKLDQNYLTNCVSLLGHPGGGALGFQKMWNVLPDKTTQHICTGNFAVHKNIFNYILFDEKTFYGAEDNIFSRDLQQQGIKILYQKSATVFHQARTFLHAIPWWEIRARSFFQGVKSNSYEEILINKFFRFVKNVFTLDIYLPGKIFCLFIMFIVFSIVYAKKSFTK